MYNKLFKVFQWPHLKFDLEWTRIETKLTKIFGYFFCLGSKKSKWNICLNDFSSKHSTALGHSSFRQIPGTVSIQSNSIFVFFPSWNVFLNTFLLKSFLSEVSTKIWQNDERGKTVSSMIVKCILSLSGFLLIKFQWFWKLYQCVP